MDCTLTLDETHHLGNRVFGWNHYQYTQMTKMYEQKIESVICIEITYKDYAQKEFQEKYRIDLSEFKGLSQIGTPPLYAMVESIQKLEKSIDNIATGWRKVQVDVFSQEDRDRERREWEKEEREDSQQSARPA